MVSKNIEGSPNALKITEESEGNLRPEKYYNQSQNSVDAGTGHIRCIGVSCF